MSESRRFNAKFFSYERVYEIVKPLFAIQPKQEQHDQTAQFAKLFNLAILQIIATTTLRLFPVIAR